MDFWEQHGFKIVDLDANEEISMRAEIIDGLQAEFVDKYANLKGYEALEFSSEETVVAKDYLENNGTIASKFNALKDVTEIDITKELDCYVKGYETEKKKLASLIYRFYLVQKNREQYCEYPYVDYLVFKDIMFDERVALLPDELKYALLKLLKNDVFDS